MKNLPNKPSALIRVALTDLALCKADPHYVINMGVYHEPNINIRSTRPSCTVCLAGAVMAKTLDADIDTYYLPEYLICRRHGNTSRQLHALDHFRTGRIKSGLGYMILEIPAGFLEPSFIDTKQGYSVAYLGRLADEFEKCGL